MSWPGGRVDLRVTEEGPGSEGRGGG